MLIFDKLTIARVLSPNIFFLNTKSTNVGETVFICWKLFDWINVIQNNEAAILQELYNSTTQIDAFS